jgi:hypothetical protein
MWPGDYTRPLSLNAWLYVVNNPINLIDPSGLKGIQQWDQYQMTVKKRRGNNFDIAAYKIGKREIYEIIRNFEGNPVFNSLDPRLIDLQWRNRPTDVHWYDCTSPDVINFVNNRVDPNPVGFDLNRYDWLFSGWADYWAWRAPAIYPPMPDMPNILKAISFRESTVGYQKVNPLTGEKQSLLNFGDYTYYRRVSTPNEKDVEEWDSTWGLMDVSTSDRSNPIMEVGATVRHFYAMYFYYKLRPSAELQNAPDDRIFRRMGAAFGQGGIDIESKACYGAKIWSIATTGNWYAGCKAGIDSNDALVDPTSSLTADLW